MARYCLALLTVALGAAAFAVLFRHAIAWVFVSGYGAPDVLSAFQRLPWYARMAAPMLGAALAGFLGALGAKLKGGHGVGDVMEAVALGKGQISLRLTLLKAFGSWLAIVSGGSIGREGPLIQFGGGFGATIGRVFKLRERQIRALIAAGAGAGFAAAYNTPIAAVLFVVEVVTGVIALDLVLPVIIAVPIATALTRLAIGGGPIYGQRTFTMNSNAELALYAALGLLAGVTGPLFMVLLARGEALFAQLPVPRAARAALGGGVVGAIAIALPQVTGNGYEAINLILGQQLGLGLLVLLLFAKAVATTASVSSGSPGGVFTPSLLLGAALGGIVGHLVARFGPASGTGAVAAYALVGMAALIAATTHAPLMATVLVFELSGDYAIVLPLLTACAIATLLSRRVHRESIYTEELRRRGSQWEVKVVATPPMSQM
ncbi:MAG TPA: chloride channel protein [Polyangiaceae bacterium]|nr:chloride channel protein [Polyangiaceae bacterium]